MRKIFIKSFSVPRTILLSSGNKDVRCRPLAKIGHVINLPFRIAFETNLIDERFESVGPVTGGFVTWVVYQTATDYSRLRVTCRCSIIFRNNSEPWEFFCDSIPGLNGILKCVTRCESDLSKFAISKSRIILSQIFKIQKTIIKKTITDLKFDLRWPQIWRCPQNDLKFGNISKILSENY